MQYISCCYCDNAPQVTLNAKRCFNKDVSYVAVDYNNHETKPVVRH